MAKYGDVTIYNYVIGTDNTVQDVHDRHPDPATKYYQFVIDKIEQAISHLDLVAGFSKRAMTAMSHTIDDRLLSHYADVDSGNIIGTDVSPITLTETNVYDYFLQAGQMLDEDNIPAEGRVAVIDPATKRLILKSPDFVKATETGDTAVRKATLGEMAGFKVVVSNRIATVSSVKNLMFFTPDLISLAMRISPDKVETYVPEKQFGTGIKGLALYGSAVFNPTAGVVLKKGA
ncbi:MAG: P22 phage major capsid protein family protein [Vampirovibrionales bacterium]